MVDPVATLARQINGAGDARRWERAWQTLGVRMIRPRTLLTNWRVIVWLVLCLPVAIYFLLGAVPELAFLQHLLEANALVPLLALIAAGAMIFGVWTIVRMTGVVATRRTAPWGEPLMAAALRLLFACGAVGAVAR